MPLVKGLYTVLAIVIGVNVVISLRFVLPRVNKYSSANAKPEKRNDIFTWKDAICFALIIIAAILLVLIVIVSFSVLKMNFLMTFVMLSYFLGQIKNSISSAKTVGDIVTGKSSTMLGTNDYTSIITVALLVSYLNTYGILDKVIGYADSQTNTILSDWILLGCYVTSIAITTFFICALTLRPLKIAIELLRKIFSNFSNQKERLFFNRLEKQVNGTVSAKTWAAFLIEYIINQDGVLRRFLWLGVPIAIVLDIVRMMVLLVYGVVILIIWYFMCIAVSIRKIFSNAGKWILSLSDRNFVVISFRIATILGFGCTVIINRYAPFLLNQESTSVFEFISSTIIIPVILEWIIAYKAK